MHSSHIKNTTKSFHAALESHPINQKLLSRSCTLDDYANFIDIHYTIFQAMEYSITQYKSLLDENKISFASRANDALDELTLLGKTPSCTLAFHTDFMDSFECALAAVYLINGSRHGAMMLNRHLKSRFTEHHFLFLQTNPTLFYEEWETFMTLLGRLLQTQQQKEKFEHCICVLYQKMGDFYDYYQSTHDL